jgi:hypothetical protein
MKVQRLEDIVWERIGDEWLVGRAAAILFIASAVASIAIVVMVVRFATWPPFLLVPGVLAGLFLISGMLRYWTMCDRGSRAARRIWFVAIVFGVLLGAALYCIFVYLPQVSHQWRSS